MFQFTLNVSLHAPLSFLFAAFHEPEYLSEWFAPGNCVVSQIMSSFKEGGKYRIKMLEPNGAEMALVGEYVNILTDEKLVFSWAWEDTLEETVMTSVDISFFETSPNEVALTLIHSGFSNQQECDQHQYAWMSCLEKLAVLADKHVAFN